jgi:hypothetical protein
MLIARELITSLNAVMMFREDIVIANVPEDIKGQASSADLLAFRVGQRAGHREGCANVSSRCNYCWFWAPFRNISFKLSNFRDGIGGWPYPDPPSRLAARRCARPARLAQTGSPRS